MVFPIPEQVENTTDNLILLEGDYQVPDAGVRTTGGANIVWVMANWWQCCPGAVVKAKDVAGDMSNPIMEGGIQNIGDQPAHVCYSIYDCHKTDGETQWVPLSEPRITDKILQPGETWGYGMTWLDTPNNEGQDGWHIIFNIWGDNESEPSLPSPNSCPTNPETIDKYTHSCADVSGINNTCYHRIQRPCCNVDTNPQANQSSTAQVGGHCVGGNCTCPGFSIAIEYVSGPSSTINVDGQDLQPGWIMRGSPIEDIPGDGSIPPHNFTIIYPSAGTYVIRCDAIYTDDQGNNYRMNYHPYIINVTSDQDCESIPNQTACETAGCYWYNNSCHSNPEENCWNHIYNDNVPDTAEANIQFPICLFARIEGYCPGLYDNIAICFHYISGPSPTIHIGGTNDDPIPIGGRWMRWQDDPVASGSTMSFCQIPCTIPQEGFHHITCEAGWWDPVQQVFHIEDEIQHTIQVGEQPGDCTFIIDTIEWFPDYPSGVIPPDTDIQVVATPILECYGDAVYCEGKLKVYSCKIADGETNWTLIDEQDINMQPGNRWAVPLGPYRSPVNSGDWHIGITFYAIGKPEPSLPSPASCPAFFVG